MPSSVHGGSQLLDGNGSTSLVQTAMVGVRPPNPLFRLGSIHVIPAIPARPVRPDSGHSANARVYEYTAYGAAVNQDAPPAPGAALRDSTPVAWYPPLYAPRAGGAHDSHHRTAGVAGSARRRGCCVAARGGRAAVGDAGDRFP